MNCPLQGWADESVRGYIGLAVMIALFWVGGIPTLWRVGKKSRHLLLGLLLCILIAGVSAVNGIVPAATTFSVLLIVSILYFAFRAWRIERTASSLMAWLALVGSGLIFLGRSVIFTIFGTMEGAL